jgi:23S rRNA (cytosine1962-C5)-methyltransferase
MLSDESILAKLQLAIRARSQLLQHPYHTALRLFNGFYEGASNLVVDLYARTLVIFSYDSPEEAHQLPLDELQAFLLGGLPWIECVVRKYRKAKDTDARRGYVTYGGSPAQQINEHGVWYAIDLLMNQDTSFYLDTRSLRSWLLEHSQDWRVLNTFAYTGSLGIAALAGGAAQVIQLDRNRKYLQLARQSGMLNRLDIGRMKLLAADFFSQVANYKRTDEQFDCVIADPPFFSVTNKGTVDLVSDSRQVINKLRPLVRDGGWLVSINNALFLSGEDYMLALEDLCQDGYLSIENIISVPEDVTGYPQTILKSPPSDPAPFNHPTKIVLMRVSRKQ